MKRSLFMPFRAGYLSADFYAALAKPREGLTDMSLDPEKRRSGAIYLLLLASELSESSFLYVLLIRRFPNVLCEMYYLIGNSRWIYTV